MLKLQALPANEGDCLVIEYGDASDPFRILIDGGRATTYRMHLKPWLEALPQGRRRLDLFVVTHIDRDHIEGALCLAKDSALEIDVRDIWFNGWFHLDGGQVPDPQTIRVLAPRAGEALSRAIFDRKWPWNAAFDRGPVSIGSGEPIVRPLPGGARLRLLSPDAQKLAALQPTWESECRRAGLIPGALTPLSPRRGGTPSPGARAGADLQQMASRASPIDGGLPNGTSIAFVFEYEDRKILFAADSHPGILIASLKAHYGDDPVPLDLFKVSHHGSQGNVTQELCSALACNEALISTNGDMFAHPDEEAVARLVLSLRGSRRLHFNYCSSITRSWADADLAAQWRYEPTYPETSRQGWCVLNFDAAGVTRSP